MSLSLRLDLGLQRLLPEWRAMFQRRDLQRDLVAGLTVACVAVPLSLAIALASGVAPAVGLVTAVVAGIVCALFGGTPLAVSGPAAAMAVLVASIVQEQGVAGLLLVGIVAGALQLATGVLGLGRYIRLVPLPVIQGFTAGIGAIILVQQLPRALGMKPPAQSHVLNVIPHVGSGLADVNLAAAGITLLTLVLVYGVPRLTRKLPPQLFAVVVASVVVSALAIDTPLIGDIPRSFPAPRVPQVPAELDLGKLVFTAVVVYALASLETLLSASAVDKLAGGTRKSDPDQELVGQGLGNLAAALFGGIPVTGVIARSATNVQAGARTRRASVFHALFLVVTVLVAAPVIGRIPIAALAGILFSVAFRMLGPATFVHLWRQSRPEALVYALTFLVIVFVDLLEGVQWGIVAALLVAAVQLGRQRVVVRTERVGKNYLFSLEGPLTFLSSMWMETLGREIALLEPGRGLVIDATRVTVVDASAAEMLAGLVEQASDRGLKPVLLGLTEERASKVRSAAKDGEQMAEALVATEHEAALVLGSVAGADARLRVGVERFRTSLRPRYAGLFHHLAAGQAPHTLFITCSDSRVHPNLITATDPGELFLVRDIGSLVPPSGVVNGSAVAAAIEYAVGILHVQKIVVCGHSGCGAIKALLSPDGAPPELEQLAAWLEATRVRDMLGRLPSSLGQDDVARLVVLGQLDHLETYDVVRDARARGELSVSAWFFDLGEGEVEEWSAAAGRFVPVTVAPRGPRREEDGEREAPLSFPKPSPA